MCPYYLQWFTVRVVDVYKRWEAAVYWDSGPNEGSQSVGVWYTNPENLQFQRQIRNINHVSHKKNEREKKKVCHFICTWYVNTPWCDVLINKVFSTFPTTRARNTTSNDVFPPGGIICWKKKETL